MVSYKIVNGIHQPILIRSYLPPSNMDHLPDLKEAFNGFLGRDTIVIET